MHRTHGPPRLFSHTKIVEVVHQSYWSRLVNHSPIQLNKGEYFCKEKGKCRQSRKTKLHISGHIYWQLIDAKVPAAVAVHSVPLFWFISIENEKGRGQRWQLWTIDHVAICTFLVCQWHQFALNHWFSHAVHLIIQCWEEKQMDEAVRSYALISLKLHFNWSLLLRYNQNSKASRLGSICMNKILIASFCVCVKWDKIKLW